MRINLMIEGQEDVSWNQWVVLAQACEDNGLEGLFRSDHYRSIHESEPRGSLDALTTLAGLAARTTRLRLGTLVSPVTFRHPALLAKSAVTIDHISSGRFELGMGAGWFELEHSEHGFEYPATDVRLKLLEEQLEIVHRQWSEGSFSFEGAHYRIERGDPLPKPVQRPHPPLIVGGSGGRRSAALAARWADEYNTHDATADECRRRRAFLERAWEAEGRDPQTLRFSLMTGVIVGTRPADVRERASRLMEREGGSGEPGEWLRSLGDAFIAGTTTEVVDKLGALAEAGVDRVMLQHLLHEDLETVALLGQEVRPRLGGEPGGDLLAPKLS